MRTTTRGGGAGRWVRVLGAQTMTRPFIYLLPVTVWYSQFTYPHKKAGSFEGFWEDLLRSAL